MSNQMNHEEGTGFLEHTIASIEKKRRFSIENANKTNLYSIDEFIDFMAWFDTLISLVKQSPPKGYVKTILAQEDGHGQITSVQYELFERNEAISDTELRMLYENK